MILIPLLIAAFMGGCLGFSIGRDYQHHKDRWLYEMLDKYLPPPVVIRMRGPQ